MVEKTEHALTCAGTISSAALFEEAPLPFKSKEVIEIKAVLVLCVEESSQRPE